MKIESMEQVKQTDNSTDYPKSIPLVICSYCRKRIPSLLLRPSNGKMNVCVQCQCSMKNRVISLNQFVKSLSKDKDLKVECSKHCKSFSHYCIECRANICIDCHAYHLSHQLFTFSRLDYEEPHLPFFQQVKAKNKRLASDFIARIEEEIKRLNQMKEDILEACEANEKINFDLELLHQSLSKTASAFNESPSYELYVLLKQQKLVINTQGFSCREQRIDRDYDKLIEYFEKSFVLKQTSANKSIDTIKGHQSSVICVAQLIDGRIASGSSDYTIKLWNPSSNACNTTLTKHQSCVLCLIQLTNGKLVSGSSDKTIKVWDTQTKACTANLIGHCNWVRCLVQLNEACLASGSNDKTIRMWNLTTKKCIAIIRESSIYCLVLLSNGAMASGSYFNTIKLWSTTTNNRFVMELTGHSKCINCLIQLNDGRLASGSGDEMVKVWSIETQKCLATLKGHTDSVQSLIQLNDGRLASASYDKTIRIWSLSTNKCIVTLQGHTNTVHCLIQLCDERITSASDDKTIKLWNAFPFLSN